jgi:hypothetical protein
MNFIGKGLVVVHTLLSLAGLTLAIVIYFEFIDWGRAEPRIVRGESSAKGSGGDLRIASEYDKSRLIFDDAVVGRDLAVAPVPMVEASLREAELRFAGNHLFYVDELERLRTAQGDIEVKGIRPEGVPTDTPGKPIGKPLLEVKVDGVSKSYTTYLQDLKTEQAQLDKVQDEIRQWVEKDKQLSLELTGKDETGKKLMHGLYELLDQEYQTQQRLKEEREYLQPQWATAIEDARRFGVRRSSLEATLAGLEKALKGQKK